jgi:hypothetical protein
MRKPAHMSWFPYSNRQIRAVRPIGGSDTRLKGNDTLIALILIELYDHDAK